MMPSSPVVFLLAAPGAGFGRDLVVGSARPSSRPPLATARIVIVAANAESRRVDRAAGEAPGRRSRGAARRGLAAATKGLGLLGDVEPDGDGVVAARRRGSSRSISAARRHEVARAGALESSGRVGRELDEQLAVVLAGEHLLARLRGTGGRTSTRASRRGPPASLLRLSRRSPPSSRWSPAPGSKSMGHAATERHGDRGDGDRAQGDDAPAATSRWKESQRPAMPASPASAVASASAAASAAAELQRGGARGEDEATSKEVAEPLHGGDGGDREQDEQRELPAQRRRAERGAEPRSKPTSASDRCAGERDATPPASAPATAGRRR